jgi:hypothetical protein
MTEQQKLLNELPYPQTFAVKIWTNARIIQIFQPKDEKGGEVITVSYDELWDATLKIGDIIKARIENKPQTPEEEQQIIALN